MWCRPIRNCDSVFCTEHPLLVPVLFFSQLKIPLLLWCGFQSVKWRMLGYINSKCSFSYVLCCRGPSLPSWALISLTENKYPPLWWNIMISPLQAQFTHFYLWLLQRKLLTWKHFLTLILGSGPHFLSILYKKIFSKCQQSLLNTSRINSPSRVVSSEVHPHYC